MGIFDFFKKITKEKETQEVSKENLAFSDLNNWIENKKKGIEIKGAKLFVLIKDKISHFTNDIEAKINLVKIFDVNARRAEDKLKSATEEGRSKYLDYLESFIWNLNNLQEKKTEAVLFNINKLFSDFNKNSYMSYERATILIGKEMGEIKNEIKALSKDLIQLFDENKDIIDFSKAISTIEIKLKQYEEIKKDEEKSSEKIITLEKEVSEKEEENKLVFEEIEKIKKSPQHLEHLKNIEECKSLKEDLERDFIRLTRIIDFKALANFHHIFEDKMEKVKSYRDKFQMNFEKDGGKEILNLLDIAKLNTPEIFDKINEINNKKEILKNKTENDADKTQELLAHAKKTNIEIDDTKSLKAREQKRLEKLKAGKEEIISEIKKEFEKIGVELSLS
ncbi:hypothetical protein HY212_04320 [Candidatus Pacearchaeota archaeon]|nr:hypothetical protein [Candidatus Pacearchaeota archaeon]